MCVCALAALGARASLDTAAAAVADAALCPALRRAAHAFTGAAAAACARDPFSPPPCALSPARADARCPHADPDIWEMYKKAEASFWTGARPGGARALAPNSV